MGLRIHIEAAEVEKPGDDFDVDIPNIENPQNHDYKDQAKPIAEVHPQNPPQIVISHSKVLRNVIVLPKKSKKEKTKNSRKKLSKQPQLSFILQY